MADKTRGILLYCLGVFLILVGIAALGLDVFQHVLGFHLDSGGSAGLGVAAFFFCAIGISISAYGVST